jgi:hypothetical protein
MIPFLLTIFFLGFTIVKQKINRLQLNSSSSIILNAYWVIAFVSELILIQVGQAQPEFVGRYTVVPTTIALVGVFIAVSSLNFKNAKVISVPMILILFVSMSISSYQSSKKFDNTLLKCTSPCESWNLQISNLSKTDSKKVLNHWPIRSTPNDWETDLLNPKEQPSPFQTQ